MSLPAAGPRITGGAAQLRCAPSSVLERSGNAHQEIPLFSDQIRVSNPSKQWIQASVVGGTVHFVEVLIGDPRTGFLEDAAHVRLARECSKEGLWLRALLTVAYSFGFRSGELLSMRVRQVDLLSRTIRLEVGSTKNDEGRITPMTDEVFKLLTACVVGKQPDDFVFTREDGRRVQSFRKRWKKVCLQAGVPDLIFHDLRRSGVRNLRRLGVQESVVMKISGHKTRSVFERYNIIDEADLTEAARKLNEKQNALGQSSGIVAPEMVKTATAPSLAPRPN